MSSILELEGKCVAGSWEIGSGVAICLYCGKRWLEANGLPSCAIPDKLIADLAPYAYTGSSMQSLGRDTKKGLVSADMIKRFDIPEDSLFKLIQKHLLTNHATNTDD